MTDNSWISNRDKGLLLETVTINGKSYATDKDCVLLEMADAHPELRPNLIAMYDRAGDKLKGMRYPAKIGELPVTEQTISFIAGIMDLMPAENSVQQDALDKAVAEVMIATDEKARQARNLTFTTIENM